MIKPQACILINRTSARWYPSEGIPIQQKLRLRSDQRAGFDLVDPIAKGFPKINRPVTYRVGTTAGLRLYSFHFAVRTLSATDGFIMTNIVAGSS